MILLLWKEWRGSSIVHREISSCFAVSVELEQNFVSQARNQNALGLNSNIEKKDFHFILT